MSSKQKNFSSKGIHASRLRCNELPLLVVTSSYTPTPCTVGQRTKLLRGEEPAKVLSKIDLNDLASEVTAQVIHVCYWYHDKLDFIHSCFASLGGKIYGPAVTSPTHCFNSLDMGNGLNTRGERCRLYRDFFDHTIVPDITPTTIW